MNMILSPFWYQLLKVKLKGRRKSSMYAAFIYNKALISNIRPPFRMVKNEKKVTLGNEAVLNR